MDGRVDGKSWWYNCRVPNSAWLSLYFLFFVYSKFWHQLNEKRVDRLVNDRNSRNSLARHDVPNDFSKKSVCVYCVYESSSDAEQKRSVFGSWRDSQMESVHSRRQQPKLVDGILEVYF